ncbi:MAG: LysM peptidoglycan-binding domain-containing protein [Gammaproteobacteria bacterium]
MTQFWYNTIIKIALTGMCCMLIASTVFAAPVNEGIKVYQKNMHLFPDRKQSLAADIDRYRNADDMWNELRQEFTLPHYENNPLVQEKINWFLNHQDYLVRSINRSAPYLYYILQQAKKRHLPAELVLLPIIESSYNPFALNAQSGAAGIWQMMPATASGYGIRQNWWYDGRRDVVASTKAALNHLSYLRTFFEGNWLLAVAAYDTGEGNVLSAIRKNINNGETTDYWSLHLAQETRDYVPQLLALATIISRPDEYPIIFPAVSNAPYLAQVDIGAQIDLKHAAALAGLSLKNLKVLNPGYSRASTDPNGPFKLILPIENVEQFSENLANSPAYQDIDWTHYKVRNGDTIALIAQRFNTTPSSLRVSNPALLHTFRLGMNLSIPKKSAGLSETIMNSEQEVVTSVRPYKKYKGPTVSSKLSLASSVADVFEVPHDNYTLQPGDTLYMVRRGDDLEKITKHFRITRKELLAANQINANQSLSPGQQLIIPTHKPKENILMKYELAPGDTIYMVREGDTIEKIAAKFHTTTSEVRLANLLATNELQEGDRLVIPTHA